MLSKHSGIEIPQDNPFVNDKLKRKIIVENLTRLVESTNQPFVISIEAPWGWGKTTFIKMWKTFLESIGHTSLYFNAWETDFVEDPLIAFVGEISKAIDQSASKAKINNHLKKLQEIGGKLVRRALPITIQIATHGLLSQESIKQTSNAIFTSGDEIAKFASEIAEGKIKQYENDKKGISEFKKELGIFATSIFKEKKPPLVFFIDELDRCRPDFAVSLLERIKHLFSTEGVVFILAIDRDQITYSIKSIYGGEMKADGYLRRFIDFSVRLPMPSTDSFCESLYNHFHLDEVFGKQKLPYTDSFIRTISALAEIYQFSPRIIEQCFTEINIVLRTAPEKPEHFSEFLAFFIALKAHDITTYAALKSELGREKIDEILKKLNADLGSIKSDLDWLLPAIEAHMYMSFLSYDENMKLISEFRERQNNGNGSESHHAKRIVGLLEKYLLYTTGNFRPIIKDILSWMDIVGQLKFEDTDPQKLNAGNTRST